MRFLTIIYVFFISFLNIAYANQSPENIRLAYLEGTKSKEKAKEFEEIIITSNNLDNAVKTAYIGASKVLNARYIKLTARKKVIDEGTELIEKAVQTNPNNPEIRLIRLTIQENLPKLLNYSSSIEEDKKIVLKALENSTDTSLKNMIKGYLEMKSK